MRRRFSWLAAFFILTMEKTMSRKTVTIAARMQKKEREAKKAAKKAEKAAKKQERKDDPVSDQQESAPEGF